MVWLVPSRGLDFKEGAATWEGIFNQKNDCAIMMCFLVSAGFFRPLENARQRLLNSLYIALAILLVLMSESRTGWVLLATLVAYKYLVDFIPRFKPLDRALIAIVVAVGMLTVGTVLIIYSSDMLRFLGKDSTLTGRTEIWAAAMESVAKRPILGYGYHAFFNGMKGESANFILRLNRGMTHAQSGFLDVSLDLGLVGVTAILLTVAYSLRNGLICIGSRQSLAAKWYLSIVILTVVTNFGERTFMYPDFLEWIMYILACVGLAEEAKGLRLSFQKNTQSSGFSIDRRPVEAFDLTH
jgi:O-antigen ligase